MLIARMLNWSADQLLNLVGWISPETNDEKEEKAPYFELNPCGKDISPAALEQERMIRQIVISIAQERLTAEHIRLQVIGLSRALGALSNSVSNQTDDIEIAMEGAGIMTVASAVEKMMSGVSSFHIIRKYSFGGVEAQD